MIVRASEAKRKENPLGVDFQVLAVGEKTMLTRMTYKVGHHVPFHNHPNEQSGYVFSGKYRILFGDVDDVIGPGDSYTVPENVAHSLEVLEPGEMIEVFAPPRKDYL